MPAPEKKPSNVYLAPAHLNHIRATIDWQGLFDGLALRRDARKSKPNDWWAYSPFKEENTASFHMGTGGIWYDFSTGQGGGPIELIQQINGWHCYEAAHYILANGLNAGSRDKHTLLAQLIGCADLAIGWKVYS